MDMNRIRLELMKNNMSRYIDYRKRVVVPIHDNHSDGKIVFTVIVYGIDKRDLAEVPWGDCRSDQYVGSQPMRKAVKRLGLDPNRYQAYLFDLA